MFKKEIYTKGDYKLNYAIDYPAGFDKSKKYPVIFYFHGMGMVQKGIDHVVEYCPVQRDRMTEDMDFIIVAPSCDDYMWFEDIRNVVGFIRNILSIEYIDNSRVYLSGSSMGGYTCWALAILHPEFFTAAVICCGGGFYWVAERITFPVMAVHGTADKAVLYRESEIMEEKMKNAGGDIILVTREGYGHDVWTETFTDHETYRWLLKHKK